MMSRGEKIKLRPGRHLPSLRHWKSSRFLMSGENSRRRQHLPLGSRPCSRRRCSVPAGSGGRQNRDRPVEGRRLPKFSRLWQLGKKRKREAFQKQTSPGKGADGTEGVTLKCLSRITL
ncbi:hypothetical protein AVEN_274733-1 [Araneus ventricosus]|uniref:Uncharacterized protein n=1 Tax=Araneus ventricosus TaxID=182803 RepID=A0A4Y2SAW0_ARAVE|nr:hypothetical protein AVEN_274733-1 [Araneus ventricosus]